MNRLAITHTLAVAGLLLAMSGCGGGGSEDGASPASPTGPASLANAPVQPNRAPTGGLVSDQFAIIGYPLDFDATLGGSLFVDPDGDRLAYQVQMTPDDLGVCGIRVEGTRIVGTPLRNCYREVRVDVVDGRGGASSARYGLTFKLNEPPRVAVPNPNILVTSISGVDHDAAQGGRTFVDPEGQRLTLRLTIESDPRGFIAQGTRIIGALQGTGFVRFKIEADDGFGGVAADTFAVVMPATISERPTVVRYEYEDTNLNMPMVFRQPWVSHDTTPTNNPTTNAGATLGRVLFYDKRLSITNTHSCASCHQQSRGFASTGRFGVGAIGALTKRSPMHLTNVRFNPRDRYFLDSRATALEGLALIPIQTNSELGSSLPQVVAELSATDFYPPLFGAAFGYSGVTEDGIARALAQFMRSFISYRAPFDRAHYSTTSPWSHDQPDPSLVLTPQELRGRDLFIAKQCFHCHMAASFASPWPDNNGLDSVTTDPIDGRFRVGSLRNIAVTGPYMHDGRFATLREVIDHYNSGIQPHPELAGPLGGSGTPFRMNFTEDDKLALEAFFHTLTDQEFLNDPKFSDPFAR